MNDQELKTPIPNAPAPNGCTCGHAASQLALDTATIQAEVARILERHGSEPEAAIPILQDLQAAFRYLPREALELVCRQTRITPAQLTGVATFYAQFRHHAIGRHLIQVCHGTACHVAGAERVTDTLRRHLKLSSTDESDDTSADGLFTIERVACLGCCTLAPVMLIDGIAYGHLDPAGVTDAVERFLAEQHERRSAQAAFSGQAAKNGTQNGKPVTEIRIGLNSCCIASGSREVCAALERAVRQMGGAARIKPVGCRGICHRVPLVEVVPPEGRPTLFGNSDPSGAAALVRRRVAPRGLRAQALTLADSFKDWLGGDPDWARAKRSQLDPATGAGQAFLGPQVRIATEHAGELDPLDLDEYLAHEGYGAFKTCVMAGRPEELIDVIRRAGLRGRGGAGFPTGQKWALARQAAGERKFVICNGDEGDPGAFMDRMMLEAYPHRVIEGLALAAFATGAREGFLYIRAEYALAVERIEAALAQAEARGLLGERLFGTDFSLRLRVKRGAGAFICGEETAMLESIEGRRGMPRLRPPYPVNRGLWDCPTCVNNVETLACVPWIVRHGPEAFATLGTARSKGTKVFALAGKVARGGLIEVPMGTTLWEIVERIGGGVKDGGRFKAVQLGGPSGGCIPARLADTPVDFEALTQTGAIMGSGGLIVMDETTCMVDMARYFLEFTQKESCGKCTFCRLGTRRMLEILERLCAGAGKLADLDELEDLAHHVQRASLCGLGRTAPNPVLTTLRYFRDEYEAHVAGRCPAGKCPALVRYEVSENCIGCTICAQQCPVQAIAPKPYARHEIDDARCTRCGVCLKACPEKAIAVTARK